MSYALIRLLSAVFCIGTAGWGLSALAAPVPIWVGTGLVVAYLFWTGKRGIFIASIWITLLVSLAIAFDLSPAFWPEKLKYRYWALCLMLIWGAAIAVIWFLGLYGSQPSSAPPKERNAASILEYMMPQVRDSLNDHQLIEVERLIGLALPKPTPKLVDLRVEIDLLINRFYIVFLVGKDRRQGTRHYQVSRFTQIGNWLTGILLLAGFNIAITITILLFAYLMKSALGINLLPGHFRGFGK